MPRGIYKRKGTKAKSKSKVKLTEKAKARKWRVEAAPVEYEEVTIPIPTKEQLETAAQYRVVNDIARRSWREDDSDLAKPSTHYDPVNHPAHYLHHPSGVECITITEHFNFNRGNAIKYIWRADEKGSTLEQLRKARWYLDREISRLEKEAIK